MDCECLDVDVLSYSHLFETKTYYVNPPKVLHKVKRDLPHKPAHMKKMSTSKRRQLLPLHIIQLSFLTSTLAMHIIPHSRGSAESQAISIVLIYVLPMPCSLFTDSASKFSVFSSFPWSLSNGVKASQSKRLSAKTIG